MGHLDELWAKYRDKGVVILAVTDEGKSLVDKFIKDTGSKHPIVIEESDSATAFGISGFPSSFLIDADGKIAWAGHPGSLQDSEIDKLLENAHPIPVLPKKLAGVQKGLEKGDYAGARKNLEGQLAGTGLDDADRKSADEAVKWIDARGAGMLASADADLKRGDAWAAAVTLRKASESFKGLETGTNADAQLKAILADKDRKREVDAGDVWEKTRDKLKAMKPDQAAAVCRQVQKKYEGTKAAEKARAMAEKYEGMAKGR